MLDMKSKGLKRRLEKIDYVFDETNPNFTQVNHGQSGAKDSFDVNIFFINAQTHYFNDILEYRGHVFLNDVLGALGLPLRAVGQFAGWRRGDVINIEQNYTRYKGFDLKEIGLRIKPSGIIVFDVLGD